MSQKQEQYRALVARELKKDRANGMREASRIWREMKHGTRSNPSGGALLKWGALGGLLYLAVKHFSAAPAAPPPAGALGIGGNDTQGAVRPRTGGL